MMHAPFNLQSNSTFEPEGGYAEYLFLTDFHSAHGVESWRLQTSRESGAYAESADDQGSGLEILRRFAYEL
jgi:hypothetical protein